MSSELTPGDRVEINPGEWATIITYRHARDEGNGHLAHGDVLFRWRNGEHAISTATWRNGRWQFGDSTYFMPGMHLEGVCEQLWEERTGQVVTLAAPDDDCYVSGCVMFGGGPGCDLCPKNDR